MSAPCECLARAHVGRWQIGFDFSPLTSSEVGPKLHMHFFDLAALAINSACLSNVCCPDRRYLYDSQQDGRRIDLQTQTLGLALGRQPQGRRQEEATSKARVSSVHHFVVRSELTAIPPPLSQGLSRVQVRCSTSFVLCSKLELIEFTGIMAGHSRSLVSRPRRTASSASVASSTVVRFFPSNLSRQKSDALVLFR